MGENVDVLEATHCTIEQIADPRKGADVAGNSMGNMASPIPWPAPVTIATLPANRLLLDSSIDPSLNIEKVTYVIHHD